MNDLFTSHPVTQFNCTSPLRPAKDGRTDRVKSAGIHRYGCDNYTNSPIAADKYNSNGQSGVSTELAQTSPTPPHPNPTQAASRCQYCNGDGYYFYYDTPTPCDKCNGTGKAVQS